MGFLKELFEKKKKAGINRGEDGVDCDRVQSEFFPPNLRLGSVNHREDYGRTAKDEASTDSLAAIRGQSHSFSYAQLRARKDEREREREKLQPVATVAAPARPLYTSIDQFSQKVELYRGSVSTVYKATCISGQSKVIIKAYHKAKMQPKHHHKLTREISAMRALNGMYVAELYATFEDPACIYLAMEYCEGGDLFKTMLMKGGLLDEYWVCVEIIAPLLRILEKMHTLKLMHRDIKPENIFLTGGGKFKLGDFGLALRFDEEIPFSRSGTLDYMAPEVLKNPSVPLQESRQVDLATLAAKGVRPYTPAVDVWAVGVLAFELVCGRPPFEVEDEAQTAALIMYSDNIKFPSSRSAQWADFVRQALVKSPDTRPSAAALLQHQWIQINLQRALLEHRRASKETLLQPLPLPHLALPPAAGAESPDAEAPARSGPARSHSLGHARVPSIPSAAPAAPAASSGSSSGLQRLPPPTPLVLPGHHLGAHKAPASASAPCTPSERLKEIQAALDNLRTVPLSMPEVPATHVGQVPPMSPMSPMSPRQSPLALRPLAVPFPDLEEGADSSSPAAKPGIKERMKFYFQRQAGGI